MGSRHRFDVKAWLLWTAGFLAFPLGGWLATQVAGRVDDAGSALLGGLVAGAVIGTGQWLVARRRVGDARVWIPATALAMGVGLVAAAWVVGYGTSLGELAVRAAITGIPLGAAQAFALRRRLANAWMWAAGMPLLWVLGWAVTTAIGIDVDRQFVVFGASGALTFMALSGVLLDRLRAATGPPAPRRDPAPDAVTAPVIPGTGVFTGSVAAMRARPLASQGPSAVPHGPHPADHRQEETMP